MTLLHRYFLPLLAALFLAVGVGSLWAYLLPLATTDWLKLLLYLSMCVLAISSMIAAQAILPRVRHPEDALQAPTQAGPMPVPPRSQQRA